MSVDETLGYCGLYCGGCRDFQMTAAGQPFEPEPGIVVTCRGCASDTVAEWCAECAIKLCAKERGHRFCLECADFPCDKMRGFMDDPRYPYHKDVPAAMARLQEVGLQAWTAEQDARWNCPDCGGRFHWFARTCPSCGRGVN